MRILLSIHHELDPNLGAPGATVRLADAFAELGHHVDILSFDDLRGPDATKRYRFPWFVAREIRRRPQYDVYDLSSGDGWVASLTRSRRQHGRSIIVARSHGLEHVMHDALIAETKSAGGKLSWKYPIYNGGFRLWECKRSFLTADLALFLNKSDQAYAVDRLGVDRSQTACVANGVAANFLSGIDAASGGGPRTPGSIGVAFIGGHDERKGVRFLRDVMLRIMCRHRQVHLGFFGTGGSPERPLAGYPADLHPRITVVPRYGNSELPELLKGFQILAFPSLSEGFPLAPVEAMACGLVLVIFDIPGPTEFIENNRDGLIAPRGDAPAFEEALDKLIRSPELLSQLQRVGIADARGYSWPMVAAHAISLYQARLAVV